MSGTATGLTMSSPSTIDILSRHLGTVIVMTTTTRKRTWDHAVPRAAALLLLLMAIGSYIFISRTPSTAPVYSHANDKASAITVAESVYDDVEAGPQRTGLPVPVAVTVADMRTEYKSGGGRVHVVVHGSHIMVTFPKEPAVCVWVPLIVDGPKQPRIVSC